MEQTPCTTHIPGQGLLVNDLLSLYHLGHDLLAGIAGSYHLKQEINKKKIITRRFSYSFFTQLLYRSAGKHFNME
jgi:hypothetical protein